MMFLKGLHIIVTILLNSEVTQIGQSAGANITACALIQQADKESRRDNISWSLSQINAYFGLSGGCNLLKLVANFHNQGLYRSMFLSIMEGEKSLEQFPPCNGHAKSKLGW